MLFRPDCVVRDDAQVRIRREPRVRVSGIGEQAVIAASASLSSMITSSPLPACQPSVGCSINIELPPREFARATGRVVGGEGRPLYFTARSRPRQSAIRSEKNTAARTTSSFSSMRKSSGARSPYINPIRQDGPCRSA